MAVTVKNISGGVKMTIASWAHTVGAANESLTVGGIIWGILITDADSSGAFDPNVHYSVSVSGNVSTVTIYAQGDVTDGRIIIFHSGS